MGTSNTFSFQQTTQLAGVREAGYTELPPEDAPHRLVLDSRRLAPTQENLERYLHNLLKRLQVSAARSCPAISAVHSCADHLACASAHRPRYPIQGPPHLSSTFIYAVGARLLAVPGASVQGGGARLLRGHQGADRPIPHPATPRVPQILQDD